MLVSQGKCARYGYCCMVLLDYGGQHKVAISTDDIYAYVIVAALTGTLVNHLRAVLLRSDWCCNPSNMLSRDLYRCLFPSIAQSIDCSHKSE